MAEAIGSHGSIATHGSTDAFPPFYSTSATPLILGEDAYRRAASLCKGIVTEITTLDRRSPAVTLQPPSRLAQLFKSKTGTTITQSLRRRRLTEAKRLLAATDPLSRVTIDESTFSRRSVRGI